MKNVAVIAEYNPFHKGHQGHIEKIKREFDAENVLVILSGDFVQRGEPALIDKMRRTQMALEGGADLVVELPPAFATASAEVFARGAVALANAAGCIDGLAFGAECDDLSTLERLADLSEDMKDQEDVKDGLKQGLSYPAALAAAIRRQDPEAADLLRQPNNVLAVEYIKALRRSGSGILPAAMKREGGLHRDGDLPAEGPASAGAIRRALQNGAAPEALRAYLPDSTISLLEYSIFPDDLSSALSAELLRLSGQGPKAFLPFADSAPELAERLYDLSPYLMNFSELTERLRTKAFTEARVRRFLIHILLGIRKEAQSVPPAALRILGLKEESSLPGRLRKSAALPLITKVADADPALLEGVASAHERYAQLVYFATGRRLPDFYRQSPVILRKKS